MKNVNPSQTNFEGYGYSGLFFHIFCLACNLRSETYYFSGVGVGGINFA